MVQLPCMPGDQLDLVLGTHLKSKPEAKAHICKPSAPTTGDGRQRQEGHLESQGS